MNVPNDNRTGNLLDRFPGLLVLRRSAAKWLRVLVLSIGFVIGGSVMIWSPGDFSAEHVRGLPAFLVSLGLAQDGRQAMMEILWSVVTFFGIGVLVSIIALLPGATDLTLDGDGFVMRNLFRRFSFSWHDVGDFAAVQLGLQKLVAFNQRAPRQRMLAAISVKLAGHNSALPDTYGLTAEDLAQLITRWQARAGEK